jgi:hypothetical protein
MFSIDLKELLSQVITSWQVLAVTGAVVLYMCLVNYVARTYHRPRLSKSKPKRKKEKAVPAGAPEETDDLS